ncbi:hypothetical protein Tco_1020667 [Tanacetum coccineum]
MIKYSFNDKEEYVAIKEDECNDLTITSEEACRAYQEIFRIIDEGWMVRIKQKSQEKRSKPDKHGHGNGKECTRAGSLLSKVKSQLKSTLGQY